MQHNVELLVRDQAGAAWQTFAGWESIRITRSIESLSGSFELAVTFTWAEDTPARFIRAGAECTVLVDGSAVITGFVDDVLPHYDDKAHGVTIRGRDRTADLIDCSAQYKSGEWKNADLLRIAQDLAKPYGVEVKTVVDVGKPFKRFKLQDSESIFEALDRAARMRGVLLMSDGVGGMLITRAGIRKIGTALVQGENILSASATRSQRDRYRIYIVKAQTSGNDFTNGTAASGVSYTVKDKQVGRNRTLITLAEDQADAADCKQRATWERNIRAGQSRRITYKVAGWKHAGGIWTPNDIVPVRDEWIGVDTPLLISTVALVLDSNGTIAELTVAPPSAFDVEPLKDNAG